MTLQQAVNLVKRLSHIGRISETGDEETSIILDSINFARRDILLELPKHYLRKTGTIAVVAGTTTYSLGSDVQKPVLFRYTLNSSEYFLTKVETETEFYKKIYNASGNRSQPEYYFEAGLDGSGNQQIIIFPIPNQAYTINYTYNKTWTTDILSTSDLGSAIPEIPLHLHNQVVVGGVYYTLTAFDSPKASEWKSDFARSLIKANAYEEEDQDSLLGFRLRPVQIKRY